MFNKYKWDVPICLKSFLSGFCGILIALSPSPSYSQGAEMDPTIQFLIDTPTTLMDKGIFEIEKRMDESNTNLFHFQHKPKIIADYGVGHSVYVTPLRIDLHVQIYPKTKIENGRDACHALIRFSEDVLGFQTGDARPEYMAEKLSEIFGHYSYAPIGHPSNLGNRLKGLFVIQGNVIPNDGDKYFCYTVGGGPIIDGQLKN